MDDVCGLCGADLPGDGEGSPRGRIVGRACNACADHFRTTKPARELNEILDAIDEPVLLMQADPRQVFAANRQALARLGKRRDQVEQHRGGQVFDCIHAFTDAGCGRDANCRPCGIKNAIVETLGTGRAREGVSEELRVRKGGGISTHVLRITTERIGDMALVRIDRFEPLR